MLIFTKTKKQKNNKFKAEDKTFHKHSCCMDDLTKTLNKNKSALSQYILKNMFYGLQNN